MKRYVIDAKAIDNAIVDEVGDLWQEDFAQTAADIATLIHQGLSDIRAHHPERVRAAIEGVVTHLFNKVWEHHQQAAWGDIDGVHTSLERRYKAVLEGVIAWVEEDFNGIVLRLSGLNVEALENIDNVMTRTTLASGKTRYIETDGAQQGKARIRALLAGRMPPDSIDFLIEDLNTISARNLKRLYFDTYKLRKYFEGKEFFDMCEAAVPERRGARGWNYDNFKKQ